MASRIDSASSSESSDVNKLGDPGSVENTSGRGPSGGGRRRAEEQPEDLIELDAPLEQAEAAEQRQLGRRQVLW